MGDQIIADNPGVSQESTVTVTDVQPTVTPPAQASAPPAIPEDVDPRNHLANPLLNLLNPAAGTSVTPAPQDGGAQTMPGTEPPAIPGQGSQPIQPPTGANEPRTIDQIPDKFKNPDGTVNADLLMKSYLGLERVMGEQGNRLGQMSQIQQELQILRGMVAQAQNPAQTQNAQPEAPPPEEPKFPWETEMTPEEREVFMEEFYEDPLSAMAKRDQQTMKAMEHRIEKMLQPFAPVIESHQYTQQVNGFVGKIQEFAKTTPDIFDYQPEIEQVIQKYGESVASLPNAVEVIYNMAKGMRPAPPQQPTFEQMLTDPANRQKILADPNIKNEILKGHVTAIKEGAPPPVMGSQPGGMSPAAPQVEIKSTNDAKKASISFFSKLPFIGQGGQGG